MAPITIGLRYPRPSEAEKAPADCPVAFSSDKFVYSSKYICWKP